MHRQSYDNIMKRLSDFQRPECNEMSWFNIISNLNIHELHEYMNMSKAISIIIEELLDIKSMNDRKIIKNSMNSSYYDWEDAEALKIVEIAHVLVLCKFIRAIKILKYIVENNEYAKQSNQKHNHLQKLQDLQPMINDFYQSIEVDYWKRLNTCNV